MNHPVLSALAAIDAALDEIAGLDPIYLSTADKQAALATATKVRSRVEALQTRVLAAALDALPVALGDARRGKAETFMLDKAAEFGPGELRNLGRGLLEYLAPDIADEHELRLLRAEDDRARAATKFTFRSRGDGITDINARVADHVANRLKAYLDAYANPRRPDSTGTDSYFYALPLARRRGEAFCWFLESILDTDLPQHGGTTTSIMVVLDYQALVSGLGVATTTTGDKLTAEEARRLACQARIIPVVLGKKGEILDLGEAARFFNRPNAEPWKFGTRSAPRAAATSPLPMPRPPLAKAMVPRRQDQSERRQAPLSLSPRPRPPPPVGHPPSRRRIDHVHATPIGRGGGRSPRALIPPTGTRRRRRGCQGGVRDVPGTSRTRARTG